MTEFPHQLLISNYGNKKEESVICKSLIRAVPSNRDVYEAIWHKTDIILKVFSNGLWGRRHLNKEWQGLAGLRERGLNCPKPLFWGRTQDGCWAVAQEKILDASTVLEVFKNIGGDAEKLNLLIAVCRELAKQHSRGVLQKDFHLGNFLLKKGEIFTIDTGQICFYSDEVERKKSLFQAAALGNVLGDEEVKNIRRLYEEYFACREWELYKSDLAMLEKQRFKNKKLSIQKGLRKCLRPSKRHLRVKLDGFLAMLERDFFPQDEAVDFVKRIDELMSQGAILKRGNTCYVSKVCWKGKEVVIKRYNDKGFIHSLRNSIMRTRARRGWLHGHRFEMLGIPTARPIGFIEKRDGILVRKSYFISEYIEGESLYNFLQNEIDKVRQMRICRQIVDVFQKLDKYHIVHRDLKYSNILIANDGPKLIDLDSVCLPKLGWWYKIRRKKSMRRFKECGGDYPDFLSNLKIVNSNQN